MSLECNVIFQCCASVQEYFFQRQIKKIVDDTGLCKIRNMFKISIEIVDNKLITERHHEGQGPLALAAGKERRDGASQ